MGTTRRNLREMTLLLLIKLRRRRSGDRFLRQTTGIRREQNITRRTMSLLTQPTRRTMRFWTGCQSLANTSSSRLNGTRGIVAKRGNLEAEDFEEVVESVFQKSYNTEQMCTNFILFILASSFLQTCECPLIFISQRNPFC